MNKYPNRKKVAVRLNLDGETVRMLDELSIKNAGSKSQAARKAIEDAYNREFERIPQLGTVPSNDGKTAT